MIKWLVALAVILAVNFLVNRSTRPVTKGQAAANAWLAMIVMGLSLYGIGRIFGASWEYLAVGVGVAYGLSCGSDRDAKRGKTTRMSGSEVFVHSSFQGLLAMGLLYFIVVNVGDEGSSLEPSATAAGITSVVFGIWFYRYQLDQHVFDEP